MVGKSCNKHQPYDTLRLLTGPDSLKLYLSMEPLQPYDHESNDFGRVPRDTLDLDCFEFVSMEISNCATKDKDYFFLKKFFKKKIFASIGAICKNYL